VIHDAMVAVVSLVCVVRWTRREWCVTCCLSLLWVL